MLKTDYKHIFEKIQAIQKGHFVLTSGNHSDTYIQCARILERPDVTSKLCRELIKPWQNRNVDIVIGPALGGIILSYELSRLFKSKAMYLERVEGNLTPRRGFTIDAASQVIVAEDVITTGGSVKEVIDVIEKYKAKVIGIISLVDRRPEKTRKLFGVEFNSIIKVTPPIYHPDKCPLCKKGIPTERPGSRGLKL
ncbi:MAG: orotate phosphoribosyltransferase [Planctomycetota bacterium]